MSIYKLCEGCKHLLLGNKCDLFREDPEGKFLRESILTEGACHFKEKNTFNEEEIPVDRFILTEDLVRYAIKLAGVVAKEGFDAVIGAARSGLLAATPIATLLHLPLFSISPVSGELLALGSGFRLGDAGNSVPKRSLFVDDTISNGGTIKHIYRILKEHNIVPAASAAIFASPHVVNLVTYTAALYRQPHYLEWCFVNTFWAQKMAYDFDGILCEDPTVYDTDPAYKEFILHAKALYLPKMFPINIISARCEYTRPGSKRWLKKHNIKADNLILWSGDSEARWIKKETVAEWKAAQILKYKDAWDTHIFAESDPYQAEIISNIAKIAVLCPAARKVFNQHLHRFD